MCAVAGAITIIALAGLLVLGIQYAAERFINNAAGEED